MSGRKETYVNVREQELRRLREQEARLRTVQQDLPDRLNRIRADTMSELTRQNARMDQRWKQFQDTANSLRSDLADLERRNQRRLQEGLAQARAEYTDLVARERAERTRQAEQMRQEYTSLIEQERAERQQQMGELQSRVGRIENREASLQQMAEAWLQDLRILRDEVAKLPHERFAPGRMGRIDGLVEQGAANLRNGASQATLGQAQDAYFQLVELRAEVLYKEQQFETEYLRALDSVRSLIEEVRANRRAAIAGDDAEEQEIEVDVDFWSKGRLSELSARLIELEGHLQKQKETLTIEQVRQVEEELAALRARLPEAVEAARLSIINSQACYNVAQTVARVMEEQGYSVETGTYEGEDQRGAYAVKMRNRGGDEFVTIITPSPDQELAYSTQMNFYDRGQDEAMRQSFADAVYEGLNQEGLQATQPVTTLGVGEQDEEARDMEKFRQRKPQVRQVAGK